MSSPVVAPESPPPSPLARAGAVVLSIAKHVVTRAVLWAVLGLVVGVATFVAFLVIHQFADRSGVIGAALLVLYVGVAFVAFGAHGVTRGVARAALELEQKFGLTRYLIDRITGSIEKRFGTTLANLPLAKFEEGAKGVVDQFLGSEEMLEGSGVTRWVLRKVRALFVGLVEKYLLKAYRVEVEEGGAGGGVSVARVRDRLHAELPRQIASLVMAPINKYLVVIVVLYFGLGLGWPKILGLLHRS
jgi:hypothetical protein